MAGYRLTKAQKLEEIKKCGRDPVYFIKHYCRIQHPIKGLIPFHLYDFQEDLIQEFNDYKFNIILKARQLGISTLTAGYIVWMMLFRREKNVLVVATKFKTAGNLVKKVKKMFQHVPEWLKIAKIVVNNEQSFTLDNGSQIQASAATEDAGRSEALSLLVIDEAAFVQGLDEMWLAIGPTLSTGGRCIALSTPNGVGNWFHKNYVDAIDQKNLFHPIKLMWDVHPDRDEEWFEEQKANYSERELAQEFQCNFNMSGDTVIDPKIIMKMKEMVKDPEYRTGWDRNYWIWENPQPGSSYLITADVCRGDGADYSTFHVIKLETMEIVAEYQGKPKPEMFAQMLDTVGREYGNAMVVVENATIGYTTLSKMKELEYPNLYHSVKGTHEYISEREAEYRSGTVAGFTTSPKTRPIIIAKLEEFLRNGLITSYSSRLIHELERFIWTESGKAEAMKGSNDDLILALAIACWVRDTALGKSAREVAYSKAMLGAIVQANTKMSTAIPGMSGYQKKLDFDQSNMKERIREQQKYMWLYKG